MHWIGSLLEKVGTRRGLLFFLLLLVAVWLGGYWSIDLFTSNDWSRYLIQLYFSRVTLIFALVITFWASRIHLQHLHHNLQKTATDLAMFRLLFFGFLAVGYLLYPTAVLDQVLPFLELPQSAQVPLPFMSWYPKIIPISETLVRIAMVLFALSIFTSFFGIKTRWSILLFTLSAFYLFIIPNLYGKVNHNHELIWLPVLLAFSPCADRFSVDAYLQKRRNRFISHSAFAYTMPFIMIWTLLGIIYFFPGFWKIWSNGLDWFLTDNVRNQLYYKWFALGDWLPVFRIDHYPFLYKLSGLYTVLFELFFIPLLLNAKTRSITVFMGIGFHFGTWVFMNIFFVTLLLTYVTFIDWSRVSWLRAPQKSLNITPSNERLTPLKWIGTVLLSFNILFGFGKWNSWPFTVYPTFDAMVSEENSQLVFIGNSSKNERLHLPLETLHQEYTSPRYVQMQYTIVESHSKKQLDTVVLNQFVNIYARAFPIVKQIDIYIERQSILPEEKKKQPRDLIYSMSY